MTRHHVDAVTVTVEGPWFAHRVRVPLFEVDLGQGVYHGNYFHLFEIGREAFFRALGYPYSLLMADGLHLTVGSLQCRYRASLHYDEEIEVQTAVNRLGRRSLSLAHRIQRLAHSGVPETTTEAVMNFVCVREGTPVPLPERFSQNLRRWMGHDPELFEKA
ncbi:MAG: thioesterase family protein [Desulfosoma sp.]